MIEKEVNRHQFLLKRGHRISALTIDTREEGSEIKMKFEKFNTEK